MTIDEWFVNAQTSRDHKVRELYRVLREARLNRNAELALWWLGKEALAKPHFATSARELSYRLFDRKDKKGVDGPLPENYVAESQNTVRGLISRLRPAIKAFNAEPSPHGYYIVIPKHTEQSDQNPHYTLRFESETDYRRGTSSSKRVPLQSSELIWERMLAPIRPKQGFLIYSNEQPEIGGPVHESGDYSGVGEVGAAFLIGRRTAHLDCELIPFRSRRARGDLFLEENTWLVFLGSAASNRALSVVKDLEQWSNVQTFSFAPVADNLEQEPWAIYSSEDSSFKKTLRRKPKKSGHQEYVLISYLKSANPAQVIIAFAGMTTSGTYAAVQYFSDDRKLDALLAAMQIDLSNELPAFEVVLKVDVFDGTFAGFSIEATKIH